MISWFRSLLAVVLSAILTVLTFGRVELNPTGTSTAEDDPDATRPAASQPLEPERDAPSDDDL